MFIFDIMCVLKLHKHTHTHTHNDALTHSHTQRETYTHTHTHTHILVKELRGSMSDFICLGATLGDRWA